MKRGISRAAAAGAAAAALAAAIAGPASGAGGANAKGAAGGTPPTLNVALTGTHGVAVSGSTVSGAVNIASTHKGHGQGEMGIIRLNPGITI
ncbi:MAG: hypothetical protein ACRDLV_11790, partial [Solirubrobacteraceae bacterium]